jgi:hypothetical protein
MTKLIVAFRNFANAPNNVTEYQQKNRKKLIQQKTGKLFDEWMKTKNSKGIK